MITPSEKIRGAVEEFDLTSPDAIALRGGTITGAITRYDSVNGAYFDGSTYIVYPVNNQVWNSNFWSCVIEFTPAFDHTDGLNHCFFNNYSGSDLRLWKIVSGGIQLLYGSVSTTVTSAQLAPHWRTNQRNVLVYSVCSGEQNLYLNGNLVNSETDANTTTLTLNRLIVGAINSTYSSKFVGQIHSIKFFKGTTASDLLTAQEAIDYYNRSTFNYQNKATCILPFGAEQHDATNNRTLDVSGKGAHFFLGDGSNPARFPTKLSSRGYSNSGTTGFTSQYHLSNGTYSVNFLIEKNNTTASRILFDARGRVGTGYVQAGTSTITANSGTKYVNGIVTNSLALYAKQFISVSGITLDSPVSLALMSSDSFAYQVIGNIYYFSLYPITLTPTQIINEMLVARDNLNKV